MSDLEIDQDYSEPKQIGSYEYESGSQYTGEWFDGKRNGMGHMRFASGVTYYGRFENGLFCGLGVLTFTDGSKYEGEFMLGWFHGHGVFKRSDGMKFEGEFRGGRVWGKGLIMYPDGSHGFPRQEGQFQDCRFVKKMNSSFSIHTARKLAMLARSQGEFTE